MKRFFICLSFYFVEALGNSKCYLCGDDGTSTITKPDVVIDLPEFIGIDSATCEQIRHAGEDLKLVPDEDCHLLDRADLRYACGCENEPNPPVASMEQPIVTADQGPSEIMNVVVNSTSTPTLSQYPSTSPSDVPTGTPSLSSSPTGAPSVSHMPSTSSAPSDMPSVSSMPSDVPSDAPSQVPSLSAMPSSEPSISHMPSLSMEPSLQPSLSSQPSDVPSAMPTMSAMPSDFPTVSSAPSIQPSISHQPSETSFPSATPSLSLSPSGVPSVEPTSEPSSSSSPSISPSVASTEIAGDAEQPEAQSGKGKRRKRRLRH